MGVKKRKADHSPPKTDRKRPDVARRLSLRKELSDFAVKVSFGGRLVQSCPNVKNFIQCLVDDYVLSISQMTVRGSLVFNEVLHSFASEGRVPEDMDTLLRACFTGVGGPAVVQNVNITTMASHPPIERHQGDWAIVTYAVNQYKTAFENATVYNFESRLAGLISAWVDKYRSTRARDGAISMILRHVLHKPKPDDALAGQEKIFADYLRARVAYDGDPDTLQMKARDLVLCTHRILECYVEFMVPGGFTMAPVSRVKRHHIAIDSTALYCIVRRVFKYFGDSSPTWVRVVAQMDKATFLQSRPEDAYTWRQYAWMHFYSYFDLKRDDFGERIVTDGVSCSVMFRRPKSEKVDDDVLHHFVRDAVRVVAIDPGRTNMVTALDIVDGEEVWRVLTRREYYNSFATQTKTLAAWNARIQDIDQQFGDYSLRTSVSWLREGYIGVYCTQFARLWYERGSKRHARVRLAVASQKRSCLDRFFQSFCIRGQPDPVVFYGAAHLRSHGTRGELAVPVKGVYMACARKFLTLKVDEYLTTKRHSVCHMDMHSVRNCREVGQGGAETRRERNARDVRGLKFCPKCKLFVNRDRDACRSILHVGRSLERPQYLRHEEGGVRVYSLDKLPPRVRRTRPGIA